MKIILIFPTLFLWCVSAKIYLPSENHQLNSRVIGGVNAPRGYFPYMVRIHTNHPVGNPRVCSGALITLKNILSSNVCVSGNVVNIDAYLGVTFFGGPDQELHPVAWYVQHATDNYPYVNLAVLGLHHPVVVKFTVAPIQLPRSSQVDDYFSNNNGYLPGWGGVTDNILRYIPLRFTPTTNCGTSTGMLCSAGRDSFDQNAAFNGDSGAPMVAIENGVHVLAGILGFTFNRHIGGTHIPKFLDWINSVIIDND